MYLLYLLCLYEIILEFFIITVLTNVIMNNWLTIKRIAVVYVVNTVNAIEKIVVHVYYVI